jgi:hypothetical protein
MSFWQAVGEIVTEVTLEAKAKEKAMVAVEITLSNGNKIPAVIAGSNYEEFKKAMRSSFKVKDCKIKL